MNLVRTFEEAVNAFQGEDEIALDLETGGFSPWKDPIHVITMYGTKSDTVALLHYPRGVKVPKKVMAWIATFPEIVTHNGTQFDILFMANNGMNWSKPKWYDTLIGEQVSIAVGRRDVRVNLQDTLKRRLGKTIDKNIDHAGWGQPELSESHVDYCTGDIKHLLDLKAEQFARCCGRETTLQCLDFEMALIPAIVQMELTGLPISIPLLDIYMSEQAIRIALAEKTLYKELGPILLSSPVQLKRVLAEKYGPKAFPDTKAERLQDYMRIGGEMGKLCEALLLYRGAKQRKNMYSDEWRAKYVVTHNDSDRIHGKFWQLGTDTGRMSGGEPNLQQVTKDMRDVFGHVEGWAVGKSDFKQIEVRVAAALANDLKMIEAINDGEDIHTFVASEAFGVPISEVTKDMRILAKAMNFLLLFGGGVDGLYAYAQANGSKLSFADIQVAYDRYFERFTGIARMKAEANNLCETRSAVPLTYPTGLRRVIAGSELRATTILNNLVQGTAAAGLKKAIAILWEERHGEHLCAAVHDELVYVAPYDRIEEVRSTIDDAMIRGMKWALEGCPKIAIGVESTWSASWRGSDDNERVTESL